MGTCGVKGPVHTECSREVGCMNLFNKSTTVQHDCQTTVYMCIHPINNPRVYQVCHVLWWPCELVQSQVNNCQATPYQQCEEPVWTQATCYTDLNVSFKIEQKKNKQTEFTSQVTVRWVLVSPQNLTPLQALPLYWTTLTVMYRNWKQARRRGRPWIIHHES